MQFVYRLGAVIFGTATFCVTFGAIGVLWLVHRSEEAALVFNAHTEHERAVGFASLIGALCSLALVAAVATWCVVRVWRWICGQSGGNDDLTIYADAGDGRGLVPVGQQTPVTQERQGTRRAGRVITFIFVGGAVMWVAMLVLDAAGVVRLNWVTVADQMVKGAIGGAVAWLFVGRRSARR
jgi:hypothetical protein